MVAFTSSFSCGVEQSERRTFAVIEFELLQLRMGHHIINEYAHTIPNEAQKNNDNFFFVFQIIISKIYLRTDTTGTSNQLIANYV